MKLPISGAIVLVGALGAVVSITALAGRSVETSQARVPVLAELFTSEGCSSCPPADDLLRRLIDEQPIDGVEVIGISEHVDYWNRLGWRDPFSSPAFTARQSEYARALRTDQIYTPQMVIDGRLQVVGSDFAAARRALVDAARAPRARVSVSMTRSGDRGARVVVSTAGLDVPTHDGQLQVLVAIVEDGLATDVVRGENARRRLRHDGVARTLDVIGTIGADRTDGGDFSREFNLEPGWAVERLGAVAFLQDTKTRRVVGAGAVRFQ